MAITFKNSAVNSGSASSTSVATTSGLNVATGDTLIVCTSNYTSGGVLVSSISDTAGNSFSRCGGTGGGNSSHTMEVWVATNCTANSSDTITVTFASSAAYRQLAVLLYSGLAASNVYDSGSSFASDNGYTLRTPVVTTANNNELIVGWYVNWDGTSTITDTSPYTIRANQASDAVAADNIIATASTGNYVELDSSNQNAIYICGSRTFVGSTGGTPGTATPSGVSATSALGTSTGKGKGKVTATGRSATASLGTATGKGKGAITATGLAATTDRGTVTSTGKGKATPTGISATISRGTVVGKGKGTTAVTGQSATASLGSSIGKGKGGIAVAGLSVTATVGTVTNTGKGTILATGRAATVSLGTSIGKGKGTIAATGQAATSSLGTVTAGVRAEAIVTGLSVTSSLGTVTSAGKGKVVVTGQSAAISLGTAIGHGKGTITATGRSATSSLGTVTASHSDPLAHLRWRVLVASADGNWANTLISEVEFHSTVGGSNVCTGGTAICSDAVGGWPAQNALDSDYATGWAAGQYYGWWGYSFATATRVVEFKLACVTDQQTGAPRIFLLQSSDDDGSTWQTRSVHGGQTSWVNATPRTFTVTAPETANAHTYWKWVITAGNGGTYSHLHKIAFADTAGGPHVQLPAVSYGSTVTYDVAVWSPALAFGEKSSLDDGWAVTNSTLPHSTTYQSPYPVAIKTYYLQARASGASTNGPAGIELYYSDDDATYTLADSRTSLTWTDAEWKTFNLPGPGIAYPSGVSATSSIGTATGKGKGTVTVTGLSATSNLGTATAGVKGYATVTGQSVTSYVGTSTATGKGKISTTGVSGTISLGTSTGHGKATVAVTGLSATSYLGTVTASHVTTPTAYPSGVTATATVGTTTATGRGRITVTGQTVTASLGTSIAKGKGKSAVTGVSATTAIGTSTGKGKGKATVTGLSLTSALGTAVASVSGAGIADPAGVSATITGGAVTGHGKATILVTGREAVISLGEVVASHTTAAFATPLGVSAAISLGTGTATGKATASPSGISAGSYLGTAVAAAAGDATVAGVSAAILLGNVVAKGKGKALPAGSVLVSSLGTVVGTGRGHAFPSGVGATTAVGSVSGDGGIEFLWLKIGNVLTGDVGFVARTGRVTFGEIDGGQKV